MLATSGRVGLSRLSFGGFDVGSLARPILRERCKDGLSRLPAPCLHKDHRALPYVSLKRVTSSRSQQLLTFPCQLSLDFMDTSSNLGLIYSILQVLLHLRDWWPQAYGHRENDQDPTCRNIFWVVQDVAPQGV